MENEQNQNLNTAPPQVQQPDELKKTSFLSSRWLRIGIGSLLVILILSGTFVLGGKLMNKPQAPAATPTTKVTSTPTPDPTADWKTSQVLDLSFKMPQEWSSFPNDPTNWGSDAMVYAQEDFGDTQDTWSHDWGPFSLAAPRVTFIDSYISSITKNLFNGKVKKSSTKLNGNLYTLLEGNSDLGRMKTAIVSNKNNIYIFELNTSDFPKYSPYFDQILSTFKFTNSSPGPTCIPRPACFDSEPRCMIPETSDMCPRSTSPSFANPGEHCGGFIASAKQCTTGYHCQLEKIADLGGTCIKD